MHYEVSHETRFLPIHTKQKNPSYDYILYLYTYIHTAYRSTYINVNIVNYYCNGLESSVCSQGRNRLTSERKQESLKY